MKATTVSATMRRFIRRRWKWVVIPVAILLLFYGCYMTWSHPGLETFSSFSLPEGEIALLRPGEELTYTEFHLLGFRKIPLVTYTMDAQLEYRAPHVDTDQTTGEVDIYAMDGRLLVTIINARKTGVLEVQVHRQGIILTRQTRP